MVDKIPFRNGIFDKFRSFIDLGDDWEMVACPISWTKVVAVSAMSAVVKVKSIVEKV